MRLPYASLGSLTRRIDRVVADIWGDGVGHCAKRAHLLARVLNDSGNRAVVVSGVAEIEHMGGILCFHQDDEPDEPNGIYHCVVRCGDLLLDISGIEYDYLPDYFVFDYQSAISWAHLYRFKECPDLVVSVDPHKLSEAYSRVW